MIATRTSYVLVRSPEVPHRRHVWKITASCRMCRYIVLFLAQYYSGSWATTENACWWRCQASNEIGLTVCRYDQTRTTDKRILILIPDHFTKNCYGKKQLKISTFSFCRKRTHGAHFELKYPPKLLAQHRMPTPDGDHYSGMPHWNVPRPPAVTCERATPQSRA